jgi:hypothetical protein
MKSIEIGLFAVNGEADLATAGRLLADGTCATFLLTPCSVR